MKTAISIDNKVFAVAEQAAKTLGMSRSELYARAVKEYVEHHLPDSVTEIYNSYYGSNESGNEEVLDIAADSLSRVEWE